MYAIVCAVYNITLCVYVCRFIIILYSRSFIPVFNLDMIPKDNVARPHPAQWFVNNPCVSSTKYRGKKIILLLDDGQLRGARMTPKGQYYFAEMLPRRISEGAKVDIRQGSTPTTTIHRVNFGYLGSTIQSDINSSVIIVQLTFNGML